MIALLQTGIWRLGTLRETPALVAIYYPGWMAGLGSSDQSHALSLLASSAVRFADDPDPSALTAATS